MDQSTQEMLAVLLARAGLEAKEGDLERFAHLIDTYLASLKALHSVDLGDEEIAPIFHPEWSRE